MSDNYGWHYKVEEQGDKTSFTRSSSSGSGSSITTTVNGNISRNLLTINKDGTWSLDKRYTEKEIEEDEGYGSKTVYNRSISEVASGTWHFLSANKSGDFKKNEKIMLYTLALDNKTTEKESAYDSDTDELLYVLDNTENENYTYDEGVFFVTYNVEESTKNKLHLKATENFSLEQYSDIYSEVGEFKHEMILEK